MTEAPNGRGGAVGNLAPEQAPPLASAGSARRSARSPETLGRISGAGGEGGRERGALGTPRARPLERGRQRALRGSGRQAGTCIALEESAACSARWRNGGTASLKKAEGKVEGRGGWWCWKMMQLVGWIRQPCLEVASRKSRRFESLEGLLGRLV